MFDAVARVLAFFYSLPVVGGSYGLAIILLTAAVMVVLMPLTLKATRSTIKMQEVQPKLRELQKKHKGDKATLNQEMMALYQANGINPVGGCLPMVAQLPVFLVLFNVLRGLSRRVSETPYFSISEYARSLRGAEPLVGENFDPKYLSVDSEFYQDLNHDTEMAFGPFDLAQEALDVIQSNFLRGIPYVLLIGFVVATSFYQQRQVTARRSGGSAGMNPQQEMIMKFLPLLSGIWSFVFPAGLVLYWATSNAFRIAQQTYITRAFYGADDDDGGSKTTEALAATLGGEDSDTPTDDVVTDSVNGVATNGSKSKSKSKPAAKQGGSSNGSDRDSDSEPESGPVDREAAWAKRRQERARIQGANKTTVEQTSRVTPKGTKPTSSKKKRKR